MEHFIEIQNLKIPRVRCGSEVHIHFCVFTNQCSQCDQFKIKANILVAHEIDTTRIN